MEYVEDIVIVARAALVYYVVRIYHSYVFVFLTFQFGIF
jgi:hypothetical protein